MEGINYTKTTMSPDGANVAAPNGWGIDKVAGSDVVLAMYGIISVVGISGNLLVCIVLLKVSSLRTNTSFFLVHLSMVDLMVCIMVIPYKILPPLSDTTPPPIHPVILGQLRCRLYVSQYPFWLCATTSIFSLVTVNLERFVAIVHPHKYREIFANKRRKMCMIAFCWFFAALSRGYMFFLYDEDSVKGCRFLGWPSWAVQTGMGLYTVTITLFSPFVLMVSVQWKVISTLKKQEDRLTKRTAFLNLNYTDRRKMWKLQAKQTLVRTLLAFVLTFAACWAPDQFMFLLYNLGMEFDFSSPIYHFGVILAVCNSCVNPIICTLTNKPFRRGIEEVFQRRRRANRVADAPLTLSGNMTATNKNSEPNSAPR